MSNEIRMPALSPTMTEGVLSRWLVKKGDEIRSGDVIAEIETDKASMEVEAVEDGVVTQLMVCLLYTSPSPRDRTRSRMPSSA